MIYSFPYTIKDREMGFVAPLSDKHRKELPFSLSI
jgi:hypothetical protein